MTEKKILLTCLVGLVAVAGCATQEPAKLEHSSILELSDADQALVSPKILKLAKSDHLALLAEAVESYEKLKIHDYTCLFVKQETMNGRLGDEQNIEVKFMPSPFSVFMNWTKNAPLGDRLVFVEGQYKDSKGRSRMVVRPKGGFARMLVGKSVLKLPDGPDALKSTLRPCTMFGFRNGLQSLIDIYALAKKNGDLKQSFGGMTEIGGRKCIVLVRELPEKKEYPSKITEICLDIETLMPLRIIGYDWKNRFSCNYEYHDVIFNAGLKEKDFTPKACGIAPPKK